jgi:hypothetical protein
VGKSSSTAFLDSLGHFRYHENRMPLHARYSLGRADLAAITANISDHLAALNKGCCALTGTTPLCRWGLSLARLVQFRFSVAYVVLQMS